MSDKPSKPEKSNDKDLDDLLDSALQDFDKGNQAAGTNKDVDSAEGAANAEIWNEEFIAQQAKLFEERMSTVFAGADGAASGDDISQSFQKMAEAAALAVRNVTEGTSTENNLSESLNEALKSLKENSGFLQEPIPPEGLAGMFQGLQLDDDSGDNPFLPVMQGMMQSLLSAEFLLPSLKELLEKYPTWLQENESKISDDDKERYSKQQELFKVVCAELEKEKPTDSTEVKNERFKIILKHMQKVQDYGQPPADLVADRMDGAIPEFDPSQMNDPSQCCLM